MRLRRDRGVGGGCRIGHDGGSLSCRRGGLALRHRRMVERIGGRRRRDMLGGAGRVRRRGAAADQPGDQHGQQQRPAQAVEQRIEAFDAGPVMIVLCVGTGYVAQNRLLVLQATLQVDARGAPGGSARRPRCRRISTRQGVSTLVLPQISTGGQRLSRSAAKAGSAAGYAAPQPWRDIIMLEKNGSGGRIRTDDRSVNSRLLYR
jgi:hypothetical protein